MKKITREDGYYRHPGKTVWHFFAGCRYWPVASTKKGNIWQGTRPKSGTLCDSCQAGEKKARKQ